MDQCGPNRQRPSNPPLPKISENETLEDKEKPDWNGLPAVVRDSEVDGEKLRESKSLVNNQPQEPNKKANFKEHSDSQRKSNEGVQHQSSAPIQQPDNLSEPADDQESSVSSIGDIPKSLGKGMSSSQVSFSLTPEPVLQRHCSQWDALAGYFHSMTLQTDHLEKMWNDVKKGSQTSNQNELSDEELLLIISNYLKMCQREAKSEFKRQNKAISKVKEQMISVVTPPAKLNPLVKGLGMGLEDPMDYENEARAINLEDVLQDDVLDTKTRMENEIYDEKMNEQFTIGNFYGKDSIGDRSLRERVGMVIMSCNRILYCIDKNPEKVLRDVKASLLERGMFRRDSRSESSSVISRRSRGVSFLKLGIGKQVFFENINRALKDLYEDVGMEDMKRAAPRASNVTVVQKPPLPRLGGGSVVITVFCETPQNWRLPYEMQMKIAENTVVGSIVQFVLEKYGQIPDEVMSSWRDEMLCSIVEPGARITIVDWRAKITGLEESSILQMIPQIASVLGVSSKTLQLVSYKPAPEIRPIALLDEQNGEDSSGSKSEKEVPKGATESTLMNMKNTDEGQTVSNPNSIVQSDENVTNEEHAQFCYRIRYKLEAASSVEGAELKVMLQDPKTLENLGLRLMSELVSSEDKNGKGREVAVKTESIFMYLDSDSERSSIHRANGTKKILPPDSLDIVKTGSIVKLAYVDRRNID